MYNISLYLAVMLLLIVIALGTELAVRLRTLLFAMRAQIVM